MVVDRIIPSPISEVCDIRIEDYTLDKFVAAKLPEQCLEIDFAAATKSNHMPNGLHGQQRCTNLCFPFARSDVAAVPITSRRQLTPSTSLGVQPQIGVVELTFNIANCFPNIEYQPGDTIGILPSNPQLDVDFVLQAIGLSGEAATQQCAVKPKPNCSSKKTANLPMHIPNLTSPRELLRDCLNLRAPPKKQFLRALAECCSEQREQQFLSSLSARDGAHFYRELVLERGYTLIHLLALCPTCFPTIELLIEQLPRLLPRPYSIACSPLASKADQLRIIFSLLPQHRNGVTTQMFERLSAHLTQQEVEENDRHASFVPMYFRETNKFRYTANDVGNGCIMIGVGTGVAPFLGFLEHKLLLLTGGHYSLQSSIVGNSWLFCGAQNRYSSIDCAHFKEFKSHQILNAHFEAFSRNIGSNVSPKYVQDLLLENCDEFVAFFMQPSTSLFVCADGATISKSIEAGVKECLKRSLEIDDAHADELIAKFRNNGKYREDLWA